MGETPMTRMTMTATILTAMMMTQTTTMTIPTTTQMTMTLTTMTATTTLTTTIPTMTTLMTRARGQGQRAAPRRCLRCLTARLCRLRSARMRTPTTERRSARRTFRAETAMPWWRSLENTETEGSTMDITERPTTPKWRARN